MNTLFPVLYIGDDDINVARDRFNNLVVTLRENGEPITAGIRVMGYKLEVNGITYFIKNANSPTDQLGPEGYVRPLHMGIGEDIFAMSRREEWRNYNPRGTAMPMDIFVIEFHEFVNDYLDESEYD